MPSTVTVHYRFHPLVNHTLAVVSWPRRPDLPVTVLHPDGTAMKVPLWMLQAQAAQLTVCKRALLPASALLRVIELLLAHASSTAGAQRPAETEHEADHVPIRRPRVGPTRSRD